MSRDMIIENKVFNVFHMCCGLGGAKKGFAKAQLPVINGLAGQFNCIGGIDVDPAAVHDFDNAGPGRGTVIDLFTHDQYVAFHGKAPPPAWREAPPADIRRAAGNQHPHVVFISAPCKGASGLLNESLSRTAKYIALNELTQRCAWLMCEAWADDPVEIIVFENVPRLASRCRHLLSQIIQLFQRFGYAVAETVHDCGEIGGLAQRRKRLLIVARHMAKVPPFLYEPQKKPLRSVGDILGRMPLPGNPAAGPMHRIPHLQWKTWVRLAFVEAGSDWRSLNNLVVDNGHLRDFLIVPAMHNSVLGVNAWNRPTGTITTRCGPTAGNFAVADPRFDQSEKWHDGQAYGVREWDESSGAITGQKSPGQGAFAVADPRPPSGQLFSKYAVTPWERGTGTVIGGDDQGAYAVADPRAISGFGGAGKYVVTPYDAPAGVVIGDSTTGHGAFAVPDPRTALITIAATPTSLAGTGQRSAAPPAMATTHVSSPKQGWVRRLQSQPSTTRW